MEKKGSEDGWWSFLKLCAQFTTPEDVKEFFDLFLTLEEKQTLATRYLLVKELLEGKRSQREIAENLKVSISKITRGSNALKIISDELRESLKTHQG